MLRHGAQLTSPSIANTVVAFFVGNLFANFLILLVVLVALARALQIELGLVCALGLYVWHLRTSQAQFTGAARWAAFCRSPIWESQFQYFRMQLLSDAALPENHKYIFACAPHGIHGYGLAMLTFEGDSSPFYGRYPHLRGKLVGLVASVLFRIPLVREVFVWSGYVDAGRSTALSILKRTSQSLYLLTGGEAESLVSEPGTDRVVLAGPGRHGFVRLALEAGALLVPVYTFHNTDTYNTNTLFLAPFRKWLSKSYRVCLPLFYGRWGTPVPFNVQLTVAVGDPVPFPSGSLIGADGKADHRAVELYHDAYIAALQALFEKYKLQAGYSPDRILSVLRA